MKVCVYEEQGKVGLRDYPVEPLKPHEVRVKVAYCSICGTDVHVVNLNMFNPAPGTILGHEVSGVVVELGPETEGSGLKVGDRVIGSPLRNCGYCEQCRRNRPQYCTSYSDMVFAGMAEYKIYNQKNVYKIPDSLSLRNACLVEPITCIMRGMDLADIKQGQTVLLSGCGGMGLMMLQAIKMKGAARITVSDPLTEKYPLAKKLGAEYFIDPVNENMYERAMEITDGLGYDVVVECSGAKSAAGGILNVMGKCGKAIYFAVYPEDFNLPVNLFDLYSKEGSIHTVYCHTEMYPRAIDFCTEIDLDSIIGAEFPLTECVDAFAAFATKKYPKVILRCNDDIAGL